jgi:cell division protein FtsB
VKTFFSYLALLLCILIILVLAGVLFRGMGFVTNKDLELSLTPINERAEKIEQRVKILETEIKTMKEKQEKPCEAEENSREAPKVIWNGNWDDLWKIHETQNTKTGP